MNVLDGPVVFVDLETNGLSPMRGRVIEVAAIRVENGEITGSINQLIDPEAELPAFITQLTGIRSSDLREAPTFSQVADELYSLLEGAVFIAHNVRFDYSFLKQEFKRVGKPFLPRQLCTVKLSRALFPEYKTHKLADIIQRHDFAVANRHRAYDDAEVLWRFLQHIHNTFEADAIAQAIAKQLKQPAMPKALDPDAVKGLPETPGVYIFEDEAGRPLYIGKSINIKKRVLQHFGRDHEVSGEFKIAQTIHNIATHQTADELQALLLESRMIKEMQPIYNKKLRRTTKLTIAKQRLNADGYTEIHLDESSGIDVADLPNILGVYPRRRAAKESLENTMKDFQLCPKLCGVEKAKGACFWHQLRKCRGACVAKENQLAYNERVREAFARRRMQEWPYASPVLISDKQAEGLQGGVIVDQWCVIGEVSQESYCEPVVTLFERAFDLDAYKILQSHLAHKLGQLKIQALTPPQIQNLLGV